VKSVLVAGAAEPHVSVPLIRAGLNPQEFDLVSTSDPDWTGLNPEDWPTAVQSFSLVLIICGDGGLTETHFLLSAVAAELMDPPRIMVAVASDAARPVRASLPYALANAQWVVAKTPDELVRVLQNDSGTGRGGRANENPYRGLVAFAEKDASDYYGRELLSSSLAADLALSLAEPRSSRQRLLTVSGPSGVGKSSLVYAGIVPELRIRLGASHRSADVVALKPGSDPLESLAVEIARAESGNPDTVAELVDALRSDPNALRIRERLRVREHQLVLVVDQFEEVFTLCQDPEARRAFIKTVLGLASHPEAKACVILTLRADFFGACAEYPDLAHAVSTTQVLVPGMSGQDLRRAIVEPAASREVAFEPGLVDRLVSEIEGQASALPLLQFALEQVWRERVGHILTQGLFEAIGGVTGALAKRADGEYDRLSAVEQRIFKRILLRMVQPGEGTEDTKRRVSRTELRFRDFDDSLVNAMCDFLTSPGLRLLTGGESAGVGTLEITHEALLTRWPRFREWIEDERQGLLHRKRLEVGASLWASEGNDPSLILAGQTLFRAIAWIEESPTDLTMLEEDFVVASIAAAVRSRLVGPDRGLRERIADCRTFGALAAPAIRQLQSDESLDVARRSVILDIERSPALVAKLVMELDSIGPEEFSLVIDAMGGVLEASADLALSSTGAAFEARTGEPSRWCALAAAALLMPADTRWQERAGDLVEHLLELPADELPDWVATFGSLRDHLEHATAKRILIAAETESGATRLTDLIRLLMLVGARNAREFARVLIALVVGGWHVQAVLALKDSGGTIQRNEVLAELARSQPTTERRAASMALLCFMDTAGEASLPDADLPANALYDAVWHSREMGVRRQQAANLLESASEPIQISYALLVIAECGGEIPEPVLDVVRQLYLSHPDAFVHATAGLVIARLGGENERDELDQSLVAAAPDRRRSWWTRKSGQDTLTLVRVPPGTLVVGSPLDEPGRTRAEEQWTASISRGLFVADRVITVREYVALHGEIEQDIAEFSPSELHPVVSQTWSEALEFAGKFDPTAGLLTEVEWEHACRAGTTTAYYFGDDASRLSRYAWYLDNSVDRTSSAGRRLLPNPFGLFDMHGGVYEWCYDNYGRYPTEPRTDYQGPSTGPGRVLRGGGYNYPAADCRSAYRYFTQAENRNARIGIRLCIREPDDATG
jgi:formylglycine-generating enzyme required for sulfatase activity